jgi:hypothetical protein
MIDNIDLPAKCGAIRLEVPSDRMDSLKLIIFNMLGDARGWLPTGPFFGWGVGYDRRSLDNL